ncbi:beta galactosidase jelly roll domain-containing protein [Fulvivirga sp. 29W222]|uniref:Beta galactosidase jelly roll domain-containing protein n=1 Tax=Fulvivirga marina TaxID=2494733 RepID=A0A937FWN9_9BACT|nr:beta galactosidase jelly roll domain-containing protein [Fulvivirga marina]MBL6446052.1 beta galactosidase jelly roll domain-containing protein [Fulvivirga marina]
MGNLRIVFLSVLSFLINASLAQERLINLEGSWKFSIGDKQSWADPFYDDSSWETIHAPEIWENQGFHGYDGFAWYRKSFDVTNLPKSKSLYLHLGHIDDADEVYLNGKLIGFSGHMPPKFKTAYKAERQYTFPAQYLNKNGPNVIAVRVFDVTREGGISSGRLGIYASSYSSSLIVDLQGVWSFRIDARGYMKTDWEQIMVPIPWEPQGYENYDGWATYKKSFVLPAGTSVENLVLVLGKIDDFDRTYLNGKLIGITRDDRPLGKSISYYESRAYTIPPGLIKLNEKNTIIIEVEDIGMTGGIWKGPVGVTTATKYYRYLKE